MSRTDTIHGNYEHTYCPDPACCDCECKGCKKTWFNAGRPSPKDCQEHAKQGPKSRFDRV